MEGMVSILIHQGALDVFRQCRYSTRDGGPCCSGLSDAEPHLLLLVKLLGRVAISRQLMRSYR